MKLPFRRVREDKTPRRMGGPQWPPWNQQLQGGSAPLLGGYANERTGAGTVADKAEWGYFRPTLGLNRVLLETVYAQSWAAKKFIDIPVEDMLIRWREWDEADSNAREKMQEQERDHHVQERLSQALRCGRLMGTGLLIIVTHNAPLNEPLDVDALGEGDLANLLVVDRYSAVVEKRNTDVYSADYGQPEAYRITLPKLPQFDVDTSRVLRFDGIKSPSGEWRRYDAHWGLSELVPVMISVMEDAAVTRDIAQLVDKASIAVVKMRHFREALAGQADADRASPMEVIQANAALMSVYRTLVQDVEDDFVQVGVSFSGLPDVMDRFSMRLAAAADIPMTRFWGQSPQGMNATGESDHRNYAMRVAAMQNRMLDPVLELLDQVLAKNAGLGEPPDYEWRPLVDLSDFEQAEITEKKVLALVGALGQGMIDEEEARGVLSGDAIIGELEESPDFLEDVAKQDELAMKMLEKQVAAPLPGTGGSPGQNGSRPPARPRPAANKGARA